jgi:two-component system, OmpR family, response regulator
MTTFHHGPLVQQGHHRGGCFVYRLLLTPLSVMNRVLRSMRWTEQTVRHSPANGAYRLLVVDDYRPGAEALTAALLLAGYDARYVPDGATALQTVAAQMPDIVVLDINMPDMDGYAVARRLRRDIKAEHVVIVAFTAQDEPTVRSDGLEAGFDAYCQKGEAPGQLLQLLEELT